MPTTGESVEKNEYLSACPVFLQSKLYCISFIYSVLNVCCCFFLWQCRDTYYVESFNHQLLVYIPKRIHFSNRVFTMRMNLAIMDWVCNKLKISSMVLQLHNISTFLGHICLWQHVNTYSVSKIKKVSVYFIFLVSEMYICVLLIPLRCL